MRFLIWFLFRASWTARLVVLAVVVAIIVLFGYREGELLKRAGLMSDGTPTPVTAPPPTRLVSKSPRVTPAPVATKALTPAPTPTPSLPTPTPSPVEVYTPTLEAEVYEVSGPSRIVFRVPAKEYNFASRHLIGLDDAATDNVSIEHRSEGDEYVVYIGSPDALETPEEDVGVFVGDVEADFCGDPQPVLTVNEPLSGAKWKPTRWYCYPYSSDGPDDVDIHVFPTLRE